MLHAKNRRGKNKKKIETTAANRHRASTSMYSLTFCVRFLLSERHQRKPAVQAAAVMLRTPRRRPITGEAATPTSHIRRAILRTSPVTRQSAASSARRPRPAGRSHKVVMSRDGRKLVTRVRVMLPYQRNPCPDCKSAQ